MKSHLTLIGDRQSGKTTMLLHYAFAEAASGETVLYEVESRHMAADLLHVASAMAQEQWSSDVAKIVRSNGNERILFGSGGRILFSFGSSRGVTADVHVLDGINGEPNPSAQRVVRAVLR